MRTDTCANCGKTIYLVKLSPTTFKWVTDPDKNGTWACGDDNEQKTQTLPRQHAPASMRESHR